MKKLFLLITGIFLLTFTSCNPEALNEEENNTIEAIDKDKIQHPDDRG
ncbi:hypothetical protein C8N46_107228 [Kordia periserrulae]|uniref:Uncharacterized protein n=1 Tax=Kordia periserrulae TaxID=701523 RepID=A0A2T6BVX7_9FLAO|nr:hypothetical protein [Kordia periserrulae]PTX60221.1 hypothetical protein C8N46_107228 [Kordia periserrulae]